MAHADAAAHIEQDNNRGKDLWELDLHGLHLQEASAALDRRCVRVSITVQRMSKGSEEENPPIVDQSQFNGY